MLIFNVCSGRHAVALATAILLALPAGAQPSAHAFTGISLQPDQSIELRLTGTVSNQLRNYLDLFPIETSPDLSSWTPWLTAVRTNRITNDLVVSAVPSSGNRYFRTPSNSLVTPLPPHTGPFRVGTLTRLLTDPSRTNRYSIATNSSFMIQCWYPANPAAGGLPERYLDPRVVSVWYSNYSHSGLSGNPTLFNSAVTDAWLDSPVDTQAGVCPVVLFSHGYACIRTMDTDVMEELASHGFVAVAIDHYDAWVSVFPDGRVVRGNAPDLPITVAQDIAGLQSRTHDVRFVLDQLERFDQEDPIFHGRLDLSHIGIFGHSYGGAIAADACAADPRLKAGLSLDGGGHTNLLGLTISQPFLIAIGDDTNPVMIPYRAAFRSLFDQLTHDAYLFQVKSAEHFDFVESPWFSPAPEIRRTHIALALRAYTLAFFNQYLKGQPDPILRNPPSDFPEIEDFTTK